MEGWSTFSNGSSLDCPGVETVGAFPGNGCCLGKDHVDNEADCDKLKQRCLFYKLFPVYLKDNCSKGVVRPLPVLIDGHQLDLYKLFSIVKERGGYAVVAKKRLWGSVSKELGLNLKVFSSVKLVYDKYLNDFERWLKQIFEEKKSKTGNNEGLLCPNLKDKDVDELVKSESNKIKKDTDFVNCKNDINLLDTKDQKNKSEDVQHNGGDNDEKICNGVKVDPTTLGAEGAVKKLKSRKRKRETLSGMLIWMKHIAKYPLDPLAQPIPKPSKWKGYKGQDIFGQFLRAREALLPRQHEEPTSGLSFLQKQKMHPVMYEDRASLGRHATGKLRCSKRLPAFVKSKSCSCCNGKRLTDVLTAKTISEPSGGESLEKQVSVGPRFQAEVPEWTGVVSESDSKWLGIQIWPLKHDSEPTPETDIGRGRQEKCNCEFQGSVACVRLHIAENRMKLKLELGSVFYHWGFDRMGEEVSLQWTTEEEKKFKDIMRSNISSQNKYFWNNPSKYFTGKTRKNLVSYYFNVFLIQLRSYQNRVTPKNVDSDDDEVQFGSLGDGFRMEAVKGPGYKIPDCSLNEQCADLEYWSRHD
uniref:Protein ECM5 n=1 Tax=Cajanus cajan TaxID=3821 RepID=A0A151TF50_CAJCA|nr:Protein ECM5 [Cajanus cajan]